METSPYFDIEDYLDEFLGPDHGVPDHGVPGYGGVGAGTAELARAAGGVEEDQLEPAGSQVDAEVRRGVAVLQR